MAQPTNYVFNYIGGMSIKAGTILKSDDLLAINANIKVVQLRSKSVKVGINNTDAVTFEMGDYAYVEAGKIWHFLENAEVAYGQIINAVV